MKKLTLQFCTFLFLFIGSANAQNLIAVQNGGNPSFFAKLDSALLYAQTDDTLYISGGIYPITDSINKKIIIVGVGSYIDSTLATQRTYIFGNLNFKTGGSGSNITGIDLSGGVASGPSVINITISRSVFHGLHLYSSCSNWALIENVIFGQIGTIDLPGASMSLFQNNLIYGFMGGTSSDEIPGFTSSTFRNNIFFADGMFTWNGSKYPIKASYSTIENNIFVGNSWLTSIIGVGYSTILNNIFVSNWIPPSDCIESNNFINIPQTDIFIDGTFHLKLTCPGKNGGRDETDIGIYGGAFPWKEGSIPFNPHIQFKNIPGSTDQNGNLNIKIRVKAQGN